MNAKNISTALLVTAAVALLVVFAFHVRGGAVADAVAVLKTTGMTCGSCSGKITAALESLKGVAVAEVDVEGGWVTVGYDAKAVRPEALAEKVRGTGFGSEVHAVVTPEQFRRTVGRNIGQHAAPSGGCGGCGGTR